MIFDLSVMILGLVSAWSIWDAFSECRASKRKAQELRDRRASLFEESCQANITAEWQDPDREGRR